MLGWILQIKGSLCNGFALLSFQILNNLECYKQCEFLQSVKEVWRLSDLNVEFIIIELLGFIQD